MIRNALRLSMALALGAKSGRDRLRPGNHGPWSSDAASGNSAARDGRANACDAWHRLGDFEPRGSEHYCTGRHRAVLSRGPGKAFASPGEGSPATVEI